MNEIKWCGPDARREVTLRVHKQIDHKLEEIAQPRLWKKRLSVNLLGGWIIDVRRRVRGN
jgi:hypothetical protein